MGFGFSLLPGRKIVAAKKIALLAALVMFILFIIKLVRNEVIIEDDE